MKKPILLLIATMMLVSNSCTLIIPNRTLLGYRKCPANDPIGWHIKNGTGKRKIKVKLKKQR
jgi:hypothetical protein